MDELKNIVQRMIDAGEPEENIATVIQGYGKLSPKAENKARQDVEIATTPEYKGPTSFWGGVAESFTPGSKNSSIEAGLKGGLGFLKGSILDIPASLVGAVKGAYDLVTEPVETIKGIPGALRQVGELAAQAGGRPEEFGRMMGNIAGQPAVTAGLAKAAPIVGPPAIRTAGRVAEATGGFMDKYAPVTRTVPFMSRGMPFTQTLERMAGRGIQSIGAKMKSVKDRPKAAGWDLVDEGAPELVQPGVNGPFDDVIDITPNQLKESPTSFYGQPSPDDIARPQGANLVDLSKLNPEELAELNKFMNESPDFASFVQSMEQKPNAYNLDDIRAGSGELPPEYQVSKAAGDTTVRDPNLFDASTLQYPGDEAFDLGEIAVRAEGATPDLPEGIDPNAIARMTDTDPNLLGSEFQPSAQAPKGSQINKTPKQLEEEAVMRIANNASGESAASAEALSRQSGMKSRGEQFVVYDRAGRERPLIGPEAVDYNPARGETYGIKRADGSFQVLTDNGGIVNKKQQSAMDARNPGFQGTVPDELEAPPIQMPRTPVDIARDQLTNATSLPIGAPMRATQIAEAQSNLKSARMREWAKNNWKPNKRR